MKLSSREKIMLIVLGIVGFIAAYYFLLLSPQLKSLEAAKIKAVELKGKVEEIKAQMDPKHPIHTEFKNKQGEITNRTSKLYPAIFQDKLITVLDEKFRSVGLDPDAVNFAIAEGKVMAAPNAQAGGNPPAAVDMNTLRQSYLNIGSTENDQAKIEIPEVFRMHELTATFNVDSEYQRLMNLIAALEKDKYKILLNNLGIDRKEDGNLTGNFSVSFVSVPKLFEDGDKDYLSWLLKYSTNKYNPFAPSANLNPGETAPKPEVTTPTPEPTPSTTPKAPAPASTPPPPSVNADFAITLRPISSDIPTVLVGKVNDKGGGEYVYADSTNFENVEIQILSNGGKLYYRYKTSVDSYPADYSQMAEFTTKNSSVIIEVLSTKRSGADDKNGINLTVINKSSKGVTLSIKGDDASRSRVKISSTSGSVTVKR